MLFDSIVRNVNVTLLCITNTPTMLYAACPEKGSFHSRRENAGLLDPLFLNFLDPLGVQIPHDIRTRFGRYLYATKCSWIINPLIYLRIHINISANLRVQVNVVNKMAIQRFLELQQAAVQSIGIIS